MRVRGSDGVYVEYSWDSAIWYLVRDDCPHLDLLVRGNALRAKDGTKLDSLVDAAPDGTGWQRWNLEPELARQRRLGEMSLELKVPKNWMLRCYVVPTLLLGYHDVMAMVEDIETELGVPAAWDIVTERPERSWSRRGGFGQALTPTELVAFVEDELQAALSIRREPFRELGPRSRRDLPLTENAIVSHWTARRHRQLRDAADLVAAELSSFRARGARNNPEPRQVRIENEIDRLVSIERRIANITATLTRLGNVAEQTTSIYLSPLFQRDHRLRKLLRAFAPRVSEALSAVESSRSHYPPVFLNRLWELWGAVWLAKEFRKLGFTGSATADVVDITKSCSWRFQRDDIVLQLDFESYPVLVDYEQLPPAHERYLPALEWAAQHQDFDIDRPFLGSEPRCSPDYLLRITTCNGRILMVGDACLASPKHHGKKENKSDAKPYTVERYRRTLGWVVEDEVVRCHPMGAFVVFPSPATAWKEFEHLPGAGDCTLLCPSPRSDPEASRRLIRLLAVVAPEFRRYDDDGFFPQVEAAVNP